MTAMNGVVRMMASTNSVEPAFARKESPRAPPFFAPDQCPSFVVSSFLPPVLAYAGAFRGRPWLLRLAPLVSMASSTSVSRSTRGRSRSAVRPTQWRRTRRGRSSGLGIIYDFSSFDPFERSTCRVIL